MLDTVEDLGFLYSERGRLVENLVDEIDEYPVRWRLRFTLTNNMQLSHIG